MLSHKRDRPAQHIRLQTYVRVREQQPRARGSLIRLLQSVGLTQPALCQLLNVNYAQSGMGSCELIKDPAGRVLGTVVHSNNLQFGIINLHERGKGSGQFFFFVARGK